VRKHRVAVGEFGRQLRHPGRAIAEAVGANLSPDPLAEGVAIDRHLVERQTVDQISIRRSFGGVGHEIRQPHLPLVGDVGGGELRTIGLEGVNTEYGVIGIVIAFHVVEVAEGAVGHPGRMERLASGPDRRRLKVVVQRETMVLLERLEDPVAVPVFYRFSQQAAGTPPEKRAAQPITQPRG